MEYLPGGEQAVRAVVGVFKVGQDRLPGAVHDPLNTDVQRVRRKRLRRIRLVYSAFEAADRRRAVVMVAECIQRGPIVFEERVRTEYGGAVRGIPVHLEAVAGRIQLRLSHEQSTQQPLPLFYLEVEQLITSIVAVLHREGEGEGEGTLPHQSLQRTGTSFVRTPLLASVSNRWADHGSLFALHTPETGYEQAGTKRKELSQKICSNRNRSTIWRIRVSSSGRGNPDSRVKTRY